MEQKANNTQQEPAADDGLVTVPDISGLPAARAEEILSQAGFYPKRQRQIRDLPGAPVVESGQAIGTNPPAGSKIRHGSQVVYYRKVNGLLLLVSSIAGLLALIAAVLVAITILTPDPIIPDTEQPKIDPDETKVLPEGGAKNRVGGILVSPTYFNQRGRIGGEIAPVKITNNSAAPQKLRFFFVTLAGNDLLGVPRVKTSPDKIKEGAKLVALDKRRANLRPGQSVTVRMQLVGDNNQPEVYGALVTEYGRGDATPASEKIKGGVQLRVDNVYQISATRIIKLRSGPQSGKLVRVRGRELADNGGIVFDARVENTGKVSAAASGQVRLFNAQGQELRRLDLESGGLLPGYQRDISSRTDQALKDLPPGNYLARARTTVGGQRGSADWNFTIDQNGRLPTPNADIAAFATPYNPGKGQSFSVTSEVLSTGTADFAPKITWTLVPFGQEKVLQKEVVELNEIAPGDRVQETVQFPGLPEIGNYEVIGTLESADGVFLTNVVVSVIVQEEAPGRPGLYPRIRDWMSAHPLETMLVGAALLASLFGAAVAGFQFWSRRRRRP